MFKSNSLVDLNSRQRLSSAPQNQSSSHALLRNSPDLPIYPKGLRNYQNLEDPLEKTKKKRVILKSRQKFPSDFFNENSEALDGHESQRNHLRGEGLNIIKAKRSNSVTTDSTIPAKTPKFSSGMSIFSNFKALDKNNETGNGLQTSPSKLLTEEHEGVFLPNQFPAPKVYKLTRSQSLVHCLGPTKGDMFKIPNHTHEIAHGMSNETYSRLETETQQNTDLEILPLEQKSIVRSKSVNKRRISSFSGFQNSLGVERLRSETNVSSYRDDGGVSQLSTDISTKILTREAQRNYSEKVLETSNNESEHFEHFGRARTPEKPLVCLPLIKKDLNKFDLGWLNRQNNCLPAPLSHRDSDNIQTERPPYRIGSSYCSATKPMNAPQRIQSQGGTPEYFGKRDNLKASMNYLQNKQKIGQTIFSTKTMARFHNSIIKAINQNIPMQSKNEENLELNKEQQTQENKEEVHSNLNRTLSQDANEENLPSNNDCFSKEKKDPCEFSFSRNFYKDKSLSTLRSLLPKSDKDKVDQLNIGKKLREPNAEYLKSKSKIFVDSDIKKKFSIVRVKHLQG